MAPRDGGPIGPGGRSWVNQPAVADRQGPPDWSDDEDEDIDIFDDDIVNDIVDDEEGRVHHMLSRILNLRFFFTKFGKSFPEWTWRETMGEPASRS